MKIQPFAQKELPDLQKTLFKRVSGIQSVLTTGSNTITYSIPFNWVKITGIEVINGENLDVVSFEVLDTPAGAVSGIPNRKLNQFAFDVNISKDYYEHKSEYDADLYLNMQIKITYNSISAKTVGINFILNEVV